MTAEQRQAIETAWAKVRSTRERIARAGEDLKTAGLAQAAEERMRKLDEIYQAAVNADSAALDEVEGALRAAGINV
jgi:hypothetical protein